MAERYWERALERHARPATAPGETACELCGREVARLTRHHLIPRTRHSNRRNKRDFDRAEVHDRIALLCRPCHSNVHRCLSNRDLEREYNTVERLAGHPCIRRFTDWIKDRPDGTSVSFARRR